MKHLILVGACYLDTILSVPHFPKEDSKLRATDLTTRRGGNCPNSLEVLQQLVIRPLSSSSSSSYDDNLDLHLVSTLPNRKAPSTRLLAASLGQADDNDEYREGPMSHCIFRQESMEPASSYILRSGESGSRTIVNYNGLSEMTVEEFGRVVRCFERVDGQTWWHFEGRIPDTTMTCIRLIRKMLPDAQISVEIEKPGREGLLELAAEADVVFYSRSWAESRGHHSAQTCLKDETHSKAFLALCTWGSDGAAAISRPTGECFVCPVITEGKADKIPVIDTVGAGDTFIAGMLYGLICHDQDWNIREKVRFAVDLATMKVQQEGFGGLGRALLGAR